MIVLFMSEKFLKASEVANRYNVSSVSVRSWIKKGLFPNAKFEETIAGSIWLIPESDLKDFVQPEQGRPIKKKEK
jgi:predicted site-specific integrase-resolvase